MTYHKNPQLDQILRAIHEAFVVNNKDLLHKYLKEDKANKTVYTLLSACIKKNKTLLNAIISEGIDFGGTLAFDNIINILDYEQLDWLIKALPQPLSDYEEYGEQNLSLLGKIKFNEQNSRKMMLLLSSGYKKDPQKDIGLLDFFHQHNEFLVELFEYDYIKEEDFNKKNIFGITPLETWIHAGESGKMLAFTQLGANIFHSPMVVPYLISELIGSKTEIEPKKLQALIEQFEKHYNEHIQAGLNLVFNANNLYQKGAKNYLFPKIDSCIQELALNLGHQTKEILKIFKEKKELAQNNHHETTSKMKVL